MALCRNDVVPGGVRAGGEFPNVVRNLDDEGTRYYYKVRPDGGELGSGGSFRTLFGT